MRLLSFVALVVACAGCGASAPASPIVRVEVDSALRAEARAEIRAEADAQAEAEVRVEAKGEARVEAPEQTEPERAEAEVEVDVPARPVPIEGAAVVEFFGIPLDDAQDVVFVLDRSGSMIDSAQVRLAHDAGAAEAETSDADGTDADRVDDGAPDGDTEEGPPDVEGSSASEAEEPPEPRAPPAPRKIDVAHAELVDALERLPATTRMNIVFFNNRLEAVAAHLVPLEEERRDALIRFVLETEPDGRTALAPAMRAAFLMNARRIVLLSDGLGNLGGDAEAVLRDAREAMRGGVRIDAIGLGHDQDAQLLQTLARESGGLYQAL